MHEMANILISANLLLVVWNRGGFRLILIDPFSPGLLASLNPIGKFFEERLMVIGEFMPRQSFQVQPGLLIHPIEYLISIVNTTACFQEHADISTSKSSIFYQNLGGHHQFEGNLIIFKETPIDVPIHFYCQHLSYIVDSIFGQLSFCRVFDGIIKNAKELLQR